MMIPFEEALKIARSSARAVGAERVGLEQALGRILAEEVHSDIDMPPFNKSAMDGYACRRADLANTLEVIETIPAGAVPQKSIGPNQCAKIMTGGMAPQGVDCVVMVEHTENPTANTVRFTGEDTADNICIKGEDIRQGDTVLHKGMCIGPAGIAALATVGCCAPLVSKRVRVGIITTGNEIVEPNETPSVAQIRNSNGSQLAAQARSMVAEVRYFGIAEDSDEGIELKVKTAKEESDVLLLSGGVSMGDFDLVPTILRRSGFDLRFERVATKPGKPTVFGVADKAFVFGLPGNPVSTFVIFEILVKPFLFKMMGHDFRPRVVTARLEKTLSRRQTERMSWIPVALTESGGVRPVEYHGSAHMHALCLAHGLVAMPVGVAEIQKGANVPVRQI